MYTRYQQNDFIPYFRGRLKLSIALNFKDGTVARCRGRLTSGLHQDPANHEFGLHRFNIMMTSSSDTRTLTGPSPGGG
jgi:hypothetical protein